MPFSNPSQNIETLYLQQKMRVADLGAGTGAYAMSAARAVGHGGEVYAIEVQKDLVAKLTDDMRRAGLSNVKVVWGDIERYNGTKLPDASMDAVIIANILFQVADKDALMDEVVRILKPGGKALVTDWSGSFGGMGPQPGQVISESSARDLFEQYGFSIIKETPESDNHWGFVAQK